MTHGIRSGSAKWQNCTFGCGRAFHTRFVDQEYHYLPCSCRHRRQHDTGCRLKGRNGYGRKRKQHGFDRRVGRQVRADTVDLTAELFQEGNEKTSSQRALLPEQRKRCESAIQQRKARSRDCDRASVKFYGFRCWFIYLSATSVDSSPISGSVIDSLATLRRSR